MKVLVAYATRHGATKGIAERIAETLSTRGVDTTLEPAAKVKDAATYDAFVVGGAAYTFHWHKDAAEFVRRNRDVLKAQPTWLFSSGPLGPDEPDAKTGKSPRETSVPREFAEFERTIFPREEHIFFGAWDPSAPPMGAAERLMRFMPAAKNAIPAGDFRDWDEIDAWARHIASELTDPRHMPADPVAAG